MKIKLIIVVSVSLLLAFCSSSIFKEEAYSPEKKGQLVDMLNDILSYYHYAPKELNDELSAAIFDDYMDRVSFGKRYFTAGDSAILYTYRHKVDDEIASKNFELYQKANQILSQRVDSIAAFYKYYLDSNYHFDFNKEEQFLIDEDLRSFAKNNHDFKMQWRQYFKYQVLTRIHTYVAEEDSNGVKTTFEDAALKAKKNVYKFFERWEERMDKMTDEDQFEIFLNAYVNVYDPHSGYFAPIDKDNFDIQMSGQLEGIGARLQEKGSYVTVASIVPGGPAALQGELEVGDKFISVQQKDSLPVNVVDMPIDEVIQKIRGKKGTIVILHVESVKGDKKKIEIERDIIQIDETYAKSTIITFEGKKYGYLNLPSFYINFNDVNGRQCAADVEKEIIKLKAEGVEGIAIDLRNNGGGSLSEVVKMAGFFIDRGPIVQVKSNGKKPEILSDENNTVLYQDDVVIMVNNFSASASEILAAALQDYNRAVIVGSSHSFGKGTVQRFFDLDNIAPPAFQENMPFGSIKLTLQKFYRVNGASTQLKGVEPDVVIPDLFDSYEGREKDYDHPLVYDEINGLEIKDYGVNRKKVVKKATKRIEKNEVFNLVQDNLDYIKSKENVQYVPLQWEAYQQYMKDNDAQSEKFEALDTLKTGLKISNLSVDLPAITSDTVKQTTNEKWLNALQRDFYLEEAIQVLNDLNS